MTYAAFSFFDPISFATSLKLGFGSFSAVCFKQVMMKVKSSAAVLAGAIIAVEIRQRSVYQRKVYGFSPEGGSDHEGRDCCV